MTTGLMAAWTLPDEVTKRKPRQCWIKIWFLLAGVAWRWKWRRARLALASSWGRLPTDVSLAAAVVRTVSRVRMLKVQVGTVGIAGVDCWFQVLLWRSNGVWGVSRGNGKEERFEGLS